MWEYLTTYFHSQPWIFVGGEMRTPYYYFPDIGDSGHLENVLSDVAAPLGGIKRTFTKRTQCHLAAADGPAEAFRYNLEI